MYHLAEMGFGWYGSLEIIGVGCKRIRKAAENSKRRMLLVETMQRTAEGKGLMVMSLTPDVYSIRQFVAEAEKSEKH